MSTTNRFLTTSQSIGTIASEKTLADIDSFLQSGQLVVNSTPAANQDTTVVDINFDTSQTDALNIQTDGLTDKVQVALNTTDITGSIAVTATQAVGSTITINDIDTGGTQTNNLNVNVANINGQAPPLGAGTATNCQRVTIANDDALLTTIDTSLSNIDGKFPTKGQKAASGSVPGVLTSGYDSTCQVDISRTNGTDLTSIYIPANVAQFDGDSVAKQTGADASGVLRTILTNDYLSTATISNFLTDLQMKSQRVLVTGGTSDDLSLNRLSLPESFHNITNTTGGDVWLKEYSFIMIVDGTLSSIGWGDDGAELIEAEGMMLRYGDTTTPTDALSKNISRNRDIPFLFTSYQTEISLGGGDDWLTGKLVFDPPIKIANNEYIISVRLGSVNFGSNDVDHIHVSATWYE